MSCLWLVILYGRGYLQCGFSHSSITPNVYATLVQLQNTFHRVAACSLYFVLLNRYIDYVHAILLDVPEEG